MNTPVDTLNTLGIDTTIWAARQVHTGVTKHYTFGHLSPANVLALAHLAAEGKWLITVKEHRGGVRIVFRDNTEQKDHTP